MDFLCALFENCSSDQCDWQPMLMCLFVGLAIGLLVWAFFACESRNRNLRNFIEIEDSEKGTFRISSAAMRDFAKNVVRNFDGLGMEELKIVDTRLGLILNIKLFATLDCELLTLRKELRDKLFAELESKLGIADQIKQINFEVVSLEKPEKFSEALEDK